MEVVAAGNAAGPAGPYQHDVQEWRHLDRLTGVLHQGRREAGAWSTDQQQYGKVVDTQSLMGDGLRGLRTRQLEVFTNKSPGQQLQVVRTTSSTSTSTSTQWRAQKEPKTTTTEDFDDLEVSVNRLDLTSQRNKANIGRSGSLSTRRPPTRLTTPRPSIHDRQNGDGKEHTDTLNDIDNWRSQFTQKNDSDADRRLNTALRNTSVDLDALDQILKNIEHKKNSFVTAESLQEVRGRLRKTEDVNASVDDGIELVMNPVSKVRSYVYGMENGTGSLESRTYKSNLSSNRTEDWYNRRKSYGFEQVHNQQLENKINKNKIESSTDSGICIPSVKKSTIINLNNNELFNVWNRRSINNKTDVEQTTITIPIVDETTKRHSIAVDETKYVNNNKYFPRRTSLVVDSSKEENDEENLGKRHKRVEFCKTEVHFAADSGKVNIVETDDKPPPTQNFRRRRRNFSKPLIHFGDETFDSNITISDSPPNSEEAPPRGILKNKLTKPRPYILGEEEPSIWGVRLRPVDSQIWRSTITVQNDADPPEFQRLLHSLRPAKRTDEKRVEDKQENKYSTKINFNSGEATVVENGRREDVSKDERSVLQKALVVRIGKPDANHTISSKTTTNTTTTKITIDLGARTARASLPPTLKSTYLIMNTMKAPQGVIPDQLEALKKLYEEDSDDSLADEEVRSYMSNGGIKADAIAVEDDVSSVVSGSWSKMRAFRNIQQHFNNDNKMNGGFLLNGGANQKDSLITSRFDKTTSSEAKVTSVSVRCDKSSNSSLDSPQTTRKTLGHNKKLTQLSSPSLVGNSIQKSQRKTEKPETVIENNKSAFSKVNKPDLLQFNNSPIYENIDEVITNLQQMEKESVMLQELTKAADQILQAVNGYTDEDSTKVTSSDEDKKHRMKLKKNLSTISETKQHQQPKTPTTSSIESVRESKPMPPVRMNRAVKLNEAKKKTNINSEVGKMTRQRRLQRASSREALLQSHGSSSEDIAQNEVIRKPRVVRRTKTQGHEEKAVARRTHSERDAVPGVQEIRHKTAISTIRSTAEKNALRARDQDLKKRSLVKPAVRGAASSARDAPKSAKRSVKEVTTKY